VVATAKPHPPLVLASTSPRRRELLLQLGIVPDAVVPPEIDESPQRQELPAHYAKRVAAAKAAAVASSRPDSFVLAADTVVACGRRILPKVDTREAAAACLELLSGRRHRVIGGICVVAPGGRGALRVITSQVAFKRLSAEEIAAYLDCGEWQGKAGGYAVQGRAAGFIPWLSGSYSNVVGLDLFATRALLVGLGYPLNRG
jgi:septum formation protein